MIRNTSVIAVNHEGWINARGGPRLQNPDSWLPQNRLTQKPRGGGRIARGVHVSGILIPASLDPGVPRNRFAQNWDPESWMPRNRPGNEGGNEGEINSRGGSGF